MASFARDHSDMLGVKSALLNESRHATERRKSPDPKRPRSGTDVEGNSIEEEDEELTDDHEHDASSNDEGPPDNSS